MEWRSMGMSPTDMDWLNGKNSTARDICLAFGFPPHLLGMSEGSTFNNVAEAKMALYEETVIPLCQSMLSDLSNFFSEHSGKKIEVVADLDGVSALAPRREMARNNARQDLNAGIITINEAREEIGYDPVTGGDEIMVPSSKLPLNFDINNMNESKFNEWLQREGFTKDDASKISKLAYDMPA
jgi:HK97 family phage portal protein